MSTCRRYELEDWACRQLAHVVRRWPAGPPRFAAVTRILHVLEDELMADGQADARGSAAAILAAAQRQLTPVR